MNTKKIIIFLIILSFLNGCQALQGQKRSDTSDEFLVEKKNPLVIPPDFDELPVPVDQENFEIEKNENEDDLKKLLQKKTKNKDNNNSRDSNLEKTILEKINQ
jgi:hypothetical protein